MKKNMKGLTLLIIGLLFSVAVIAQPPGRPPNWGTGIGYAGNQNPLGPGPVGAPIEPGTGLMLLLGLGYGLGKIYQLKNRNTTKKEA